MELSWQFVLLAPPPEILFSPGSAGWRLALHAYPLCILCPLEEDPVCATGSSSGDSLLLWVIMLDVEDYVDYVSPLLLKNVILPS